MSTTSIKLKKAFRTAWRKHPKLLFCSILLTLGGLGALGYSIYYLVHPTTVATTSTVIVFPSSSSSSTGIHKQSSSSSSSSSLHNGITSIHSSSSSSTGTQHISSSSNNNQAIQSSSASNLLSSSSSASSFSGFGGVYYVNAATSIQGYYGVGAQGSSGVIQVGMPGVNRFSQQDYGFYFFNPLYTGYQGSFHFYSNQTTYNLTVVYNTYSNSVPSILVLLNAPQAAAAPGSYFVFYQILPVYQGTVDIDGRCGSVSVSTNSGLLVLTALNNTFTHPQKTYCTVLTSSLANTTIVVPPSLKNAYAYSGSAFPGDVDYDNGCAVKTQNAAYQTQIHYSASTVESPSQSQIFVSFGPPSTATFMNVNQIPTQICTALGYCELVGNSPCSLNTSYCSSLSMTTYQCICNPGFTGPPACNDNTILQLPLPQPGITTTHISSPLDDLSRPYAQWEQGGAYINFYPVYQANPSYLPELELSGFKGCYFIVSPPDYNFHPVTVQNEFCMELNTQIILNNANNYENQPYDESYQPVVSLAVFVAKPGIYTTPVSGYTNIYNVQTSPLQIGYVYPLLTFQNLPATSSQNLFFNVFTTGSYCEVYSANAVLNLTLTNNSTATIQLTTTGGIYYTNAVQFTIPTTATVVQFLSVPYSMRIPNSAITSTNWQLSGFSQPNLALSVLAQGTAITGGQLGQNIYVDMSTISHAGDTLYLAFTSINNVFQLNLTQYDYYGDTWGYGPFLSYSVTPAYCELYANPCLNGGTCLSLNQTNYVCRCGPGFNGTLCQLGTSTTGWDQIAHYTYSNPYFTGSFALSADGSTVVTGNAESAPDGTFGNGYVTIMSATTGTVLQTIRPTNVNGILVGQLGGALAISSNGSVIVASSLNNWPYLVIYNRSASTTWNPVQVIQSQLTNQPTTGSQTGFDWTQFTITSDASVIAAGVPWVNAGVVNVWRLNGNGIWNYSGTLYPVNCTSFCQFGYVLSFSATGSVLAISSAGDSNYGVQCYGAMFMFRLNSTSQYNFEQKLVPSGHVAYAGCGSDFGVASSISMSPNGLYIAMGDQLDSASGSEAGAVWVYRYNVSSGVWIGKGGLIHSSNPSGVRLQGFSVSIAGGGGQNNNNSSMVLLVGAGGNAIIWNENSTSWTQYPNNLVGTSSNFNQFVAMTSDTKSVYSAGTTGTTTSSLYWFQYGSGWCNIGGTTGSQKCNNRGSCISSSLTYTCICDSGYSGPTCT